MRQTLACVARYLAHRARIAACACSRVRALLGPLTLPPLLPVARVSTKLAGRGLLQWGHFTPAMLDGIVANLNRKLQLRIGGLNAGDLNKVRVADNDFGQLESGGEIVVVLLVEMRGGVCDFGDVQCVCLFIPETGRKICRFAKFFWSACSARCR